MKEKRILLWALLYALLLPAVLLLSTGCHDLNNIVDPEADAYQGYHTVATAAEVGPDNPEDGTTSYYQVFYASSVLNSSDLGPYHFRISSDSSFTNLLFNDNTITQHMVAPDLGLPAGATCYWAVMVSDSGDWTGSGAYSRFATAGVTADVVTPEDGGNVNDSETPLSWDGIIDAVGYELQIADTENGVAGATAVVLTEPEYSIFSSNEELPEGQTYYWRVRPYTARDALGTVYGYWSDVFSVSTPIFYEDFEDTDIWGDVPDGWYMSYYADDSWFVTDYTSKEGSNSLHSEDISDNETAGISVDVSCPRNATVSFYKKVSSESGCDELTFYIDMEPMESWSGTLLSSFWTYESFSLSEGDHVLTWEYSKDGSISTLFDGAWIDWVRVE